METINVELKLDHKIDIDVRLDDVIDGINECEMKRRWNYIAKIINGVQMNLSDLTDEQKAIIKKYLTDKLSLVLSISDQFLFNFWSTYFRTRQLF